jgi:hypothetical protein
MTSKRQSGLSRTSLETSHWDRAIVNALGDVIAALGLPETMATWEQIAADLSRLARKSPPWGRKYVHNVYRGNLPPSKAFAAAVEKLAQTIDGIPVGMAGAAYVRVLADPARIDEGVLIPANAQVVKCARPGCPVRFVKTHPRQQYHDPECRRKSTV